MLHGIVRLRHTQFPGDLARTREGQLVRHAVQTSILLQDQYRPCHGNHYAFCRSSTDKSFATYFPRRSRMLGAGLFKMAAQPPDPVLRSLDAALGNRPVDEAHGVRLRRSHHGNLSLSIQALTLSVSNSIWLGKRKERLKHSGLATSQGAGEGGAVEGGIDCCVVEMLVPYAATIWWPLTAWARPAQARRSLVQAINGIQRPRQSELAGASHYNDFRYWARSRICASVNPRACFSL